jgi:hypothetical protein
MAICVGQPINQDKDFDLLHFSASQFNAYTSSQVQIVNGRSKS